MSLLGPIRRLAALRVSLGGDQRWLPDALLNGVEQKPEEKRIACALDAEIGRVRVAEERGPAQSCLF
jgi:hypothetical protein